MATKYYDTPIGPLTGFLYINEPDVKFKPEGEFKAQMTLSGADAQALKAKVDAAVDEAFDAHVATLKESGATPKALREWTKHYPYDVEENDDGSPTGSIKFLFRQNHKITSRKTGTTTVIQIGLYDAAGKEMHSKVFGGSIGRIRYSLRPAPQTSAKKVGVRLDFAMVQIVKMADRQQSGFGAVEGGYEESEQAQGFGRASEGQSTGDAGGDY